MWTRFCSFHSYEFSVVNKTKSYRCFLFFFHELTGTLTQNIMTFNKCSINGRVFGDIVDMNTGDIIVPDEVSSNKCIHCLTFKLWFDFVVLDCIFLALVLKFSRLVFSFVYLFFLITHYEFDTFSNELNSSTLGCFSGFSLIYNNTHYKLSLYGVSILRRVSIIFSYYIHTAIVNAPLP